MKIKNLSLSFFTVILVLLFIEISLRFKGSNPRIIHDFALNEPVTNIPDKNLGWSPKIGQHIFKPWSEDGKTTNTKVLGRNIDNNENMHLVVNVGNWFSMTTKGNYSLIGCTVAPAFEYNDFELAPPDWEPNK